MFVVTSEQMREMDRLTIHQYGTPSLALMERAGARVTSAILQRFSKAARDGVLIVAGKGNNGGDGFVVARLLKRKRIRCEVALLGKAENLAPDAAHNYRAFRKLKGTVTEIAQSDLANLKQKIAKRGLLVDAILGTGIKSEVQGLYASVIELMNSSGIPIVAVDIPSGLDTDRGTPWGAAIRARMTVALGYPKLGEVIHPGVRFTGDLVVADIGIDPRAREAVAPACQVLTEEEMRELAPRRMADTHKGSYGHVAVIAGSRGKTGAAILACRAAMRMGAGLVTLAAPRSLNGIFASSLVEVMTELLRDGPAEELEAPTPEEWKRLLEHKQALLIGPGIGVNEAGEQMLRWLLKYLEIPWVIDADGLNNLALDLSRLRLAKTPPVLTPHPGEMARLIDAKTATVNQDRVGVARRFAIEHRCHVVLKGSRSVIATREGAVFVNPTGNPGMASGGMGDVLAGMLAALLGQGLGAQDAMRLGVFLHGFVGDRLAREKGEVGLIASDLIEGIPAGLRALSDRSLEFS